MKNSKSHRVLILGCGYAGMMAAARIGSRAAVTLVDARPGFSQRIRFHELLAGGSPKTLDHARWLGRRGARFLQARVEALAPERRLVTARSGDGGRIELEYDTLILALGSATAAGVPGVAEHAVRLDDPETICRMAERVRDLAGVGGKVLVAGGGLTGLETATELAEHHPGLRVTLATRGRVGEGYSAAGAEHLRDRLSRLGVAIRDEVDIRELESTRALTAGGAAVDFDLCVWTGGFAAPPLAREAGLAVDLWGRALVDPALRTLGRPEIFVAGDSALASFPDGRAIRMGCVSAMPMGAHAGESVRRVLRGEEPAPFDFAFTLRCISLGRKEGLVQFVASDDAPKPKVWTGRRAVFVKEAICRLTYGVVRDELRFGLPLYRWPRRERAAVSSSVERAARA